MCNLQAVGLSGSRALSCRSPAAGPPLPPSQFRERPLGAPPLTFAVLAQTAQPGPQGAQTGTTTTETHEQAGRQTHEQAGRQARTAGTKSARAWHTVPEEVLPGRLVQPGTQRRYSLRFKPGNGSFATFGAVKLRQWDSSSHRARCAISLCCACQCQVLKALCRLHEGSSH